MFSESRPAELTPHTVCPQENPVFGVRGSKVWWPTRVKGLALILHREYIGNDKALCRHNKWAERYPLLRLVADLHLYIPEVFVWAKKYHPHWTELEVADKVRGRVQYMFRIVKPPRSWVETGTTEHPDNCEDFTKEDKGAMKALAEKLVKMRRIEC